MNRWTLIRRLHVVALAAAVIACSEPTAPPLSSATDDTPAIAAGSSGLVECPTNETQSTLALVGAGGGTVSLGGTRIDIPEGALPALGLSLISLRMPASQYVEVDVRVNGLVHFQFAKPVAVAIDYGRCTRSDIDRVPLRVWYINSVTKAFIADMGGVDDKSARTVTFETDHFSGYAIAQ
jgi:hypothetical protein